MQFVARQFVAVQFVAVQFVAWQFVGVQCVAVQLTELPQKLFMCRWCSFLGGSCDIVRTIFVYKGGQSFNYVLTPLYSPVIIHYARPKIINTPLKLIFRR